MKSKLLRRIHVLGMDDLFNSLSILSLVTKISYKTELNVDENNLKYG